ncbi:MAG: tetraacyldisaccharide 4'-kinase [Campylobacterota bacterium]|nr:tetraacyldisaccharide 4'-kinase [Campylobacterota bacterium]
MNSFFVKWVEQYLFFPTPLQRLIGVLLLPPTVIYCVITSYKRLSKKPINFGIPVVSIGNLLVGGTGKTPVIISLVKPKKDVAVILRGYGRESKGLFVISNNGKILEDVTVSGDEAMLLAQSLPNTTIIVSENRTKAILKAQELGCKTIFLDDGYGQHDILKYDVLLRPRVENEPTNIFCLPTGGYKDSKMMYSFADVVLVEQKDFKRVVTFKFNDETVENLPEKIVLLTAISKTNRLLEYLPKNIETIIYPDHHNFTQENIDNLYLKYPNYNIVVTAKDMVKLDKFNLENIYLMDLEVIVEKNNIKKIDNYINSFI